MSNACLIAGHLIEEGTAARAHFQVWWTLRRLARPRFHQVMNVSSYVEFFHTSNSGHYKLIFVALSKIFDRDSRVAGVRELRDALRAEGKADLGMELAQALKPLERRISRILNIRNQSIAHNDRAISRAEVYKSNPIAPDEIRDVIDLTCAAINHVADELGIAHVIYEDDRLERATLGMLEVLERGTNC
jgi:hypothetical protein